MTSNKTMTVDVYCSQAFNVLAKVTQGGVGAPDSATGQGGSSGEEVRPKTSVDHRAVHDAGGRGGMKRFSPAVEAP